ncbi:hypothetical protein GUJ93_ZPchr0016g2511 [Zizania palustris]|uniref:RING-type domain-containing protein n=1 Tax=Zizania palustris TaxID=103762 RepID=A0A8J5TDK4_ZIZPA|nr:hypothetical protein GUJ93_ZPchr0016g2511 [Zizania palustris]
MATGSVPPTSLLVGAARSPEGDRCSIELTGGGHNPPRHRSVGDGGDGGGSRGIFGSSGIGRFGYGVGASVDVLMTSSSSPALTIYFCSRTSMPAGGHHCDLRRGAAGSTPRRRRRRRGQHRPRDSRGAPSAGIWRGEEAKAETSTTTQTCCPVCLENYRDSDVLRVLPDCGHLFHRDCVDQWLRQHPTFLVCRTSPLPSTMPMPLAVVRPL